MKIHFISYGNDRFKKSKERIKQEAIDFGEFDSVEVFGPEDLDEDFQKEYADVLSAQRGGGYWIWKPQIIKQKLDKIDKDDLLLYLDSGSTINPKGKKRFFEYIDVINKSQYGILAHPQIKHLEYVWTTKQVFDFFDVELDSEIAQSPQLHGGGVFMKNCDHANFIFQTSLDTLRADRNLFTDYYADWSKGKPQKQGQIKGFIENRHDQSIFSVVCKKYGAELLKGNELDGDGKRFRDWCPFWFSRIRE